MCKMRIFIFIIAFLIGMAAESFAARQSPVTGHVTDSDGAPVEFANVIFMRDSLQMYGTATDVQGRFSASVPEGKYLVRVQYLGYQNAERQVDVRSATDCGLFTLQPADNRMDAVVVSAPLVRREADRFVVDVANVATAVGKDGSELLRQAPGIWISDDNIQINGKSGSKVYVNGRELRMETSQLLAYLRSLRAEDISRIEVIPQSGADYDADSAGGIIMITLRRQREQGATGTLSLAFRNNSYGRQYFPSASINWHRNRLDLYANASMSFENNTSIDDESTAWRSSDTDQQTHSETYGSENIYSIRTGAVYEINDRHSIGGEFNYYNMLEDSDLDSDSRIISQSMSQRQLSDYIYAGRLHHYMAVVNYIFKIDTLGSTLKLIADYTDRSNTGFNDMSTVTYLETGSRDSLYRNDSRNRYRILTASAALEKNFSHKTSLKAGIKYTRNDMRNNGLYEYLQDEQWTKNDSESFNIDYIENIAAAYAIFSVHSGRWNAVAGLRGEFTASDGGGSQVRQRYFSLFPNANVSRMLDTDGNHMLVMQYSRTISRPGFWSLSPQRRQISDYIYQIGNPDLKPSYTNSLALSYIFRQKYSITLSANISRDAIEQVIEPDPSAPNVLRLTSRNYGKFDYYTASLNLPVTIARWWNLNAGATFGTYGQTEPGKSEQVFRPFCYANGSTTFILPKEFTIDLSYWFCSRIWRGETMVMPQHSLSLTVSKHFFDKRLTITAGGNLLDSNLHVRAISDQFTRVMTIREFWKSPRLYLRAAYNFKAGKAFRQRAVESGSSEESSRLN